MPVANANCVRPREHAMDHGRLNAAPRLIIAMCQIVDLSTPYSAASDGLDAALSWTGSERADRAASAPCSVVICAACSRMIFLACWSVVSVCLRPSARVTKIVIRPSRVTTGLGRAIAG
jgi:hypothetical protein